MELKDANNRMTELRQRIAQLHPENCPYCGGYHRIRVTRDGMPMPENLCCDDMMREILRLEREIFERD